MKIKRIEIKNFRSFGDEGIVLKIKDGLNIIVGENNVGKSNILRALRLVVDVLDGTYSELEETEWHKNLTTKDLQISVEFSLYEEELKLAHQAMLPFLGNDKTLFKQFKKEFGDNIWVMLSHKKVNELREDILFKWGKLYLKSNNRGFLNINERHFTGSKEASWGSVINRYPKKSIKNAIKGTIRELQNPGQLIYLEMPVYNIFRDLFKENFKLFEDIRQKPRGTGSGALESFDGSLVPDVLFNLRNDEEDKNRNLYHAIEDKFCDLFTDLYLVPIKRRQDGTPAIRITDKTTGHNGDLNSMGTGIIEIVIFLTNIIGSINRVYGVEDPELHLHPHGQRLLLGILEECEKNNQIILITHSPSFIDVEHIDKVILARKGKGGTTITQLTKRYFASTELSNLNKILDAESKEIFFSRKILLVEGPTEKGALPVFAKGLKSNFDSSGLLVVSVEGKTNFAIYIKLLEGFDIPYTAACDKDAIMQIGRGKINNSKTSSLLYQLNELKKLTPKEITMIEQFSDRIVSYKDEKGKDKEKYDDELFDELKRIASNYNCHVFPGNFEDILKKAGYEYLMEEAKDIVGTSKVRIGRYVTEKILDEGKETPKEFKELIEML